VADLPLGANRYVQRASGYDWTIVNGRILAEGDELTDERPGRVVRGG
jgi:N-acyl-D-amino-acid deacylase